YVFYVEDDCENSAEETVTVTREWNEYTNCETAFGLLDGAERCFLEDGFNRWGWTNHITEEDTYIMPLYAGAGRCIVGNGTLVGYATVEYSGGDVTVSIDINEGFAMSEAHIYIGCDKYPTLNNGNWTVAPGQYPYNWGSLDYVNDYSMVPISVDGPFWIIVHTVVCEVVCQCSEGSPQNGGVFIPSNNGGIDCGQGIADNSTKKKIDFNAYPVPFDSKLNI